MDTRNKDPRAHILRPARRVKTEGGSGANDERLLKRAGPWLVGDADFEGGRGGRLADEKSEGAEEAGVFLERSACWVVGHLGYTFVGGFCTAGV